MNKGLEALGKIKEFYPVWRLWNREDFYTIETELERLEILEEAYKKVADAFCDCCEIQSEILRIIKEKRIDFGIMPYCLDLETYNNAIVVNGNEWTNYKPLAQAEFDLLKDWFK